jgi:hypothetical protein
MLRNWEPGYFPWILELLDKHEALNESRRIIHELIDQARQTTLPLAGSESRASLLGITEFLAQQTDFLGVTP